MTDTARLRAILAAHRGREGALLPILQDVQQAFGFIPDDTYATIAAELGLTRAEVAGVVGFYHDFRKAPAGRHVIRLSSWLAISGQDRCCPRCQKSSSCQKA